VCMRPVSSELHVLRLHDSLSMIILENRITKLRNLSTKN
jgi:hypothetical protein